MSVAFDYQQLEAVTGGDLGFEREVLMEYLHSAPADIERIEAAVVAGDPLGVDRAAHTLKGASATVGASGLAAVARDIEHAARTGDLAGAGARLTALREAFEETAEMLQMRIARAA